jgi:hypothetical protein
MGISTAEIQSFLKDMDYPASKDDLIERAKENGAGNDVISLLDQLPDQEYTRPTDVNAEIGKIE